jgi:hypothetical protein
LTTETEKKTLGKKQKPYIFVPPVFYVPIAIISLVATPKLVDSIISPAFVFIYSFLNGIPTQSLSEDYGMAMTYLLFVAPASFIVLAPLVFWVILKSAIFCVCIFRGRENVKF